VATVTLYDGETGERLLGPGQANPPAVVSTEDPSKLTFALDPAEGRAVVQFAVAPDGRRLLAGLAVEDGDDLPALHRGVTEHIGDSEFRLAPPGVAAPHLNVFHYLAAPDTATPDAEIRAHVVGTDDPLEVRVPSAATAANLAAFFRERAPWKSVAVHAPGAGVSGADVAVVVDPDADGTSYVGREDAWTDEAAVPEGTDDGGDVAAADAGAPSGDGPSGIRLYDGATGDLEYDSGQGGAVDGASSDAAQRRYEDGLALSVDPGAGEVWARLRAADDDAERRFVVRYDHDGDDDPVEAFAAALADLADDVGTTFVVDVAGDDLQYDRLTTAAVPSRPEGLSEADAVWLARAGGPVDFVAPDGATAFMLASFLRDHLDGDRSMAVATAGRTDDLAGTDVVVAPDPDSDGVEARGETATRLADRRLRERLTDVGGAVDAMVARIDEFTGTIEARQRVFAAALSGDVLGRYGRTVAPVDDDPIGRRRRQARYLALYAIVLAVVAWWAQRGMFDDLPALLEGIRRIQVATGATYEVEAYPLIAWSAAALVAGAYWLFGYPRGPLASARALVRTGYRQVTGGAGSGTVPSVVQERADPVQDALAELHDAYERLADVEGTVAADPEDYGAFVQTYLLDKSGVPDVEVVNRGHRLRRLLLAVVRGLVVGTLLAALSLVVIREATRAALADPTLATNALLGLLLLVAAASLLKGALLRYGGGRMPGWWPAR
jgi:hypothetical protein